MLKRFFISVLGTMAGLWISIGLLVFAGIVAAGVLVAKGTSGQITEVKDKSVLYFDLSGVVSERYQPTNIFELIQSGQSGPSLTLDEMIRSLQAAADDDRILGLYLDCNGAAIGPASREELLAAIGDFKEAGKWIIAYADSYTQSDYMLASTADTVSLNPVGCIDIHGAGGMTPFYKGLLEKLGVKVQIIKVGTFKSAVEPYVLSQMSEPARLQMQQYIDSIWDYTAGAIADNRDIAVGEIKALAPQMLMAKSGDYFIENRLADNLLYRRQVDLYLKELCGLDSDEDLRLIAPSDYLSSGSKVFGKRTSGDHVAVYYAVGDISDSGKEGIVGSEVVNDIIDLADDDNVLGLVLRVNSPGGSAFASEQIWEALQYFKSKDKPLYVSMGDYAASGGYYISCGADTIFADRTTITGSIGVFGMIPDLSGLVSGKLGVNFSTVETNENAAGLSMLEPMTPYQYQAMQKSVEDIYELFTARVAQGRGMPQDSVKAIAEGRVWTGGRALQLGLVDKIGSLRDAIDAMTDECGLESDEFVQYPVTEEKIWDAILRESGKLDVAITGELDPSTLKALNTIKRLRQAAPIQARMEDIEIR